MTYVASNTGTSLLVGSINATATSFSVTTGQGALFPAINTGGATSNEYTRIVFQNAAGTKEVVEVVRHDTGTDAFTIGVAGSNAANVAGRGAEGSTAASWTTLVTTVACRPTAKLMEAAVNAAFDVGTHMLFAQTAAPTGWTKSTTHNNKALRVVSGSAGSGGSVAFTSAFASKTPTGTNGGTAISSAQMPSHTHTGTVDSDGSHTHSISDPGHTHLFSISAGGSGSTPYTNSYSMGDLASFPTGSAGTGISIVAGGAHTHTFTTAATGSGSTHTHSFTGDAIDLAVQYVDVIIATRD